MAAEDDPDGMAAGDSELEFEPLSRAVPRRRRWWRILFLSVLLVGGGAGAWVYLSGALEIDEGSKIPLIRAEKSPVKVRPASPGGVEVPDQDKLVYERMQGRAEPSRPERLLPPPETPLPPPAPKKLAAAAPSAKVKPVEEMKSVAQPTVPTTKEVLSAKLPPPPPAAPAPDAPPRTPLRLKSASPPEPAVASAPASAPKPAPRPAAKKIRTGDYKIQLAAVRLPGRAKEEWQRLRKKHSDLLGGLELSVVKADLGPKKGVFYRLRAGPIDDVAAARDLCAKLTQRKVGCLVVRPEG